MNCQICKNEKIRGVNYDIFKEEKQNKICKKCQVKYLISNYFTKIPIKNNFIWHFYLSEEKIPDEIKNNFNQLLRPYYLIADYFQKTVFVLDDFFNEKLFKIIDNLNFGAIITITYDSSKNI